MRIINLFLLIIFSVNVSAQRTIDAPFEFFLYNTDSLILKNKVKKLQKNVRVGRNQTTAISETFYDTDGRPIKQVDFIKGNIKDTLMVKENIYKNGLLSENIIFLYPNIWDNASVWDFCRYEIPNLKIAVTEKIKRVFTYQYLKDSIYIYQKCYCNKLPTYETSYFYYNPKKKHSIHLDYMFQYLVYDPVVFENFDLLSLDYKHRLPKIIIDSSRAIIRKEVINMDSAQSYIRNEVIKKDIFYYVEPNLKNQLSSVMARISYLDSNKIKDIIMSENIKTSLFYIGGKYTTAIKSNLEHRNELEIIHMIYDKLGRKSKGMIISKQGEFFYLFYEYKEYFYSRKFYKFKDEELELFRIEKINSNGLINKISYFNDKSIEDFWGVPNNKTIEYIYNYSYW